MDRIPSSFPLAALCGDLLDGSAAPDDRFDGRVALIVNVASQCGLTPQYAGLQALHAEFADRGLTVVGVPCNQFGAQEPGSAEEIIDFCTTNFGVDFLMLEKQDVNGEDRSGLYIHLVHSDAGGGADIAWNFEKFLVDPDGRVVGRFAPTTTPDDPALRAAILAQLDVS